MWGRIPDGGSVNFYEGEDCTGRVVHSSEQGSTSNSYELRRNDELGDTVRSLLVMEYSRYPIKGIERKCESAKLSNATATVKATDEDSSASWGDRNDSNLSVNWFDALPNKTSDGSQGFDSNDVGAAAADM
ncbi:hypothetical protein PRIC1_003964 [Phytophthora ramorum]